MLERLGCLRSLAHVVTDSAQHPPGFANRSVERRGPLEQLGSPEAVAEPEVELRQVLCSRRFAWAEASRLARGSFVQTWADSVARGPCLPPSSPPPSLERRRECAQPPRARGRAGPARERPFPCSRPPSALLLGSARSTNHIRKRRAQSADPATQWRLRPAAALSGWPEGLKLSTSAGSHEQESNEGVSPHLAVISDGETSKLDTNLCDCHATRAEPPRKQSLSSVQRILPKNESSRSSPSTAPTEILASFRADCAVPDLLDEVPFAVCVRQPTR